MPSAPQASGWHQLKLTGLTHTYHEADPPVLRDLQLELTRGRRYALIGASGSGKTSLMRVLAGLDRPTQGQLRLDGEEIPDLSTRLRREATLIPQQAEIFEGSIADNLLLGAQAEPQVLDAALRASCIEAFVAAQPGDWTATWPRAAPTGLAVNANGWPWPGVDWPPKAVPWSCWMNPPAA